jgi:hypothetical protein
MIAKLVGKPHADGALFLGGLQYLPGFRIDKMNAPASDTGYGLVSRVD